MKLKQTTYKTIEIAEDEEYGMVVGNIVMDGDKMLYAEIVGGTICNHEELANACAFLDEVGEAMETETVHNILNGCCEIEMLPNNFWSAMRQKDATIKQQSNAIEELKDRNVDDLKEMYDLHESELEWFKDVIYTRDLTIKGVNDGRVIDVNRVHGMDREINEYQTRIKTLEAELSARKADSAMLMKVVEAVKQYDGSYKHGTMNTFTHIFNILVDYLVAPEGPHNSPTDSRGHNVPPDNTSYTVEIDIRCE